MRYRLRTLHILLGIAPPLLAGAYWTATFCYSYPHVPMIVAFILANVAVWIFGPVALYRGLMKAVCGPDPALPVRRKSRRKVRFRYERQAGSSPCHSPT